PGQNSEPCQPHQFTCQNGRCVAQDFVCDGDNDCGDESDELEHMCRTPAPTCPPGNFRCENGHCIDLSRCDGEDDCGDHSDEDPAHCSARTCRPGQFKCRNGRCIPQAWKCDVDDDCGDNSDEPLEECSDLTAGLTTGVLMSRTVVKWLEFIRNMLLSCGRDCWHGVIPYPLPLPVAETSLSKLLLAYRPTDPQLNIKFKFKLI
uniref:Uncharacterized protein n=1 Tax=Oryzias latipes TaxID=8090 RepID=A0A3P9I7U2_ORYLA